MPERGPRNRTTPPPLAPRRPPNDQLSLLDDTRPAQRTSRGVSAHGARRPRGPRFGEQFDLFPPTVEVHQLDPRAQLGARTRVAALWRVTIGGGEPHLIFRDRHGIYCEAHGPDCRAIAYVPRQA